MDCGASCCKYLVFIFNLIFALAGLALITVGTLVKLNVINGANSVSSGLEVGAVIMIVIGCIVFCTSFLGCCGAINESICLLNSFSIILLIIFVVQIAIAIFVFIKVNDKTSLNEYLTKALDEKFNKMDYNVEAKETMYNTEKWLKCCGVRGPEDYIKENYPSSCCKNTEAKCTSLNNELNDKGCVTKFSELLNKYKIIIVGVAIGIAVIELMGVFVGFCLACSIRNGGRRIFLYS